VDIDSKETFGRYFEDFFVGETINHWPGKTITESDNNLFCLLTMNHHPVHLDIEYCKTHQHGKILVVGTLVLSLSVGMTVSDISGKAVANLKYNDVVHVAPVFIGDTLYVSTKVLDLKESKSKKDRGVVLVESNVVNQNGDVVLEFNRTMLILKKIKIER
jgi:acyl dehydratase